MIDVAAFGRRVRGMIADPKTTLADHCDPLPPWSVVAREHVVPLIVATSLVSALLLILVPPPGMEGSALPLALFQLLARLAVNVVALAVIAGLVALYSGMFGGRREFDAAWLLAALAFTPLYVAEAIWPLPAIGPIAGLAGLIYSLVILYQGGPIALDLPDKHRAAHFVLTLLSLFLVLIVAGLALGPFLLPANAG